MRQTAAGGGRTQEALGGVSEASGMRRHETGMAGIRRHAVPRGQYDAVRARKDAAAGYERVRAGGGGGRQLQAEA